MPRDNHEVWRQCEDDVSVIGHENAYEAEPRGAELVRRTPLAERRGRERMFFTTELTVAAFEARGPAGEEKWQ